MLGFLPSTQPTGNAITKNIQSSKEWQSEERAQRIYEDFYESGNFSESLPSSPTQFFALVFILKSIIPVLKLGW